ncbi:histidine kinase dimerization/phosphoacceptor domain-containing protein [Streptomyces sp. TRM66268-LWL]|uniref:histidine kinase n=1 Tax=Streptomyces polyasparticus TaxID=2767826 RepID=A0ABR7ST70_9ACTN|nr:histidine kinase [Streptomyces polyasparticus]MBC9717538.1 histidine kinase dimerization/phosphoacceptor domain-containing protein [Streptomyces polyasparticus]
MTDGAPAQWPARRVDALVVAACCVLGFANAWVKPSNGLLSGQPTATVAAVSGLIALFLWWRRSWPLAVALVIICCHVLAFTPIALAVALFTVGMAYFRALPTLVWVGVAACLADLGALWAGHDLDLREVGYSVALAIGPLVVGYAVAVRRERTAAVRTELAALEREQDLRAERARAGERARIAREMHDVVAHRAGHIVLWAGSLRLGAGAADAQVADKAEQIRHEGRQALEELREILGVLLPGRAGEPARVGAGAGRRRPHRPGGTRTVGRPAGRAARRRASRELARARAARPVPDRSGGADQRREACARRPRTGRRRVP